jgi:2-C-methyl-D-erythritol 2,4-cyclodiphosphate synthase
MSGMRVGIGYDSHRFAEGRPLVLGGVTIEHDRGLAGWSDGDAAAHALTDAILGAAGLGDIGQMFPPDNPKWKDAQSLDLLRRASLKAAELGFSLGHADITIIAEGPKLSPHVDAMREKLGEAAVAGYSNVSVKAKTNEGMGFIGRGEGIAVFAVVLLEER